MSKTLAGFINGEHYVVELHDDGTWTDARKPPPAVEAFRARQAEAAANPPACQNCVYRTGRTCDFPAACPPCAKKKGQRNILKIQGKPFYPCPARK